MTEEIFEDFNPETLNQEQNNAELETTESTETPLQNTEPTFRPNDDENIIGEISPGGFDNIMKILRVLIRSSSVSSILIRQSKIVQEAGYFLDADMTEILNYNNSYIDLDITNPGKVVKKFEELRSNGNIFILNDEDNNRYIVTNGQVKLYLPKQDQEVSQEVQNYDLNNSQIVAQKNINKNIRNTIRNLAKEADYIEYLIQDEALKAISVPDGVFVFNEYINDQDANKLDETNADLTLRSSTFLPIEAEEYNLYLVKLSDDNYVSVSTCRVGQVPIQITESCDITTGGNLII